jgi:SAM-dependent methyltransferase
MRSKIIELIYKNRFINQQERDAMWKVIINSYLNKYFDRKDSVMEIACGYGEFINNIKCKKKYALDLNKQVKNKLNKDVLFYLSSATKIPQKIKNLDKVFISNFFEHITRKEIIEVIKEIKRVLKTGGEVVVLQPNYRFCAKDYWMFFDHITPIDDRALIEVFLANGFKCRLNIEKFLPYTTNSKLPQSSIFIKIYLKLPFLWKVFGKQSLLIFEK